MEKILSLLFLTISCSICLSKPQNLETLGDSSAIEIVEFLSTNGVSNDDYYPSYEVESAFIEKVDKAAIDLLLNKYFGTTDQEIKWQLLRLMKCIASENGIRLLIETHNDARVINEPGHLFFAESIFPIITYGQAHGINNSIEAVLGFMGKQKIISINPYSITCFDQIDAPKELYEALDLDSPYSDSYVVFNMALGSVMTQDNPENADRIKRVITAASQNPNDIICQGLLYMLSQYTYDLSQLGKDTNIEAYDFDSSKELSREDKEWIAKFQDKLKIWNTEHNSPKRLKQAEKDKAIEEIYSEIESAKSQYAMNNEETLNGTEDVKFKDILPYINELREYHKNNITIKSLKDLEEKAGVKIKSLGTYSVQENSNQGKSIVWGKIIE
jgi:hypothetical protein